jgi:hypothetical protein
MCSPSSEEQARRIKHAKEHPIFGTDMSKDVSDIITDMRELMLKARDTISDVDKAYPAWGERLKDVEGLLTCGVRVLYSIREEIIEFEIKAADQNRGDSIEFNSRGIGLDVTPGCFVCGTTERHETSNHYMNNISGFVKTREDGWEIVSWFEKGARLDFRAHEPHYLQVKIGACDNHKSNLEALHEIIRKNKGVMRKQDITDAIMGED